MPSKPEVVEQAEDLREDPSLSISIENKTFLTFLKIFFELLEVAASVTYTFESL